MEKLKSYVDPDSVAWWGGAFAIVLGVLGIFMPESYAVTEFGKAVMLLLGGNEHSSPGMMIAFGMGIIGIRAKLERDKHDV
jgi:hypothetical protein